MLRLPLGTFRGPFLTQIEAPLVAFRSAFETHSVARRKRISWLLQAHFAGEVDASRGSIQTHVVDE